MIRLLAVVLPLLAAGCAPLPAGTVTIRPDETRFLLAERLPGYAVKSAERRWEPERQRLIETLRFANGVVEMQQMAEGAALDPLLVAAESTPEAMEAWARHAGLGLPLGRIVGHQLLGREPDALQGWLGTFETGSPQVRCTFGRGFYALRGAWSGTAQLPDTALGVAFCHPAGATPPEIAALFRTLRPRGATGLAF